MPKVSKVKVSGARTAPKQASKALPNVNIGGYTCVMCGRHYSAQKGNFPASHSTIYRANAGYIPVCNKCVDELFEHYSNVLGNEYDALERMCMKFDVYWNSEVLDMVIRGNPQASRFRTYIARTNLGKYVTLTYDDTIREAAELKAAQEAEAAAVAELEAAMAAEAVIEEIVDAEDLVTPEMIEFWGTGYTPSFYLALEKRYARWTEGMEKPLSSVDETTYKQISLMECTITRDSAAGKNIEKSVSTLNSMLASIKKDGADTEFENLPFGVGIKMYENTRPIPQPDPEFADVDGIVRYISIWFLGHLCKMLNIRNTYCKLYEDELAKMRLERPDLEEEDDETLFSDIFGDTVNE